MNLSGAQLKYLSALYYQLVPLKCKIKRSNIVQLLPIHLELLSNTYPQYNHNAFVSREMLRSGHKKTFPFP